MYKYIWITILSLVLPKDSYQVGRFENSRGRLNKLSKYGKWRHWSVSQIWVIICRFCYKYICGLRMFPHLWNWLINELQYFVPGWAQDKLGQDRKERNQTGFTGQTGAVLDFTCAAAACSHHHLQVKIKPSTSQGLKVVCSLPFVETRISMWDDALVCTLPEECQCFSIGLTHFKWFTHYNLADRKYFLFSLLKFFWRKGGLALTYFEFDRMYYIKPAGCHSRSPANNTLMYTNALLLTYTKCPHRHMLHEAKLTKNQFLLLPIPPVLSQHMQSN